MNPEDIAQLPCCLCPGTIDNESFHVMTEEEYPDVVRVAVERGWSHAQFEDNRVLIMHTKCFSNMRQLQSWMDGHH